MAPAWARLGTYGTIACLMIGFDKGARSIGTPATAWQIKGIGDFDGIGKSDVLWRNTGAGNSIIWQMNGFTKQATGSIGAPTSAWQLRC